MLHKLKIRVPFANAVVSGDKTFEVRENDRGYQKGDHITFTAVTEGAGLYVSHDIESRIYEITYVLNGWGIQPGYVVFGIKEAKDSIS